MASLVDVVEPVLARRGLDLEDITSKKAGGRVVVRITVDGDGAGGHGLTLDEVAEASQEISRALDDSDVMGEVAYVLEVGTRGVDAPLTRPAHWRRNIGRLVAVTRTSGQPVTARILGADETGAELSQLGRVAFTDVVKAQVQVEMTAHDDDSQEDEV